MGRIISIVSGKGGVGKSTVALNLASTLSGHYGRKVALVDLNLTTPHMAAMTGLHSDCATIEDVVSGQSNLSSALHAHESGARILPSSITPRRLTPAELGRIGPVLRELRKSYDDVILDSGPGLGKEALLSLRYGDELLYVSTPTLPSLMDVIRCKRSVRNLGKRHLGLVLNMVAPAESQLSAEQASHLSDMPVLCSVPHDKAVPRSVAAERATVYYDYHSPASRAFIELGAKLTGKPSSWKRRGLVSGLLSYLFKGSKKA